MRHVEVDHKLPVSPSPSVVGVVFHKLWLTCQVYLVAAGAVGEQKASFAFVEFCAHTSLKNLGRRSFGRRLYPPPPPSLSCPSAENAYGEVQTRQLRQGGSLCSRLGPLDNVRCDTTCRGAPSGRTAVQHGVFSSSGGLRICRVASTTPGLARSITKRLLRT